MNQYRAQQDSDSQLAENQDSAEALGTSIHFTMEENSSSLAEASLAGASLAGASLAEASLKGRKMSAGQRFAERLSKMRNMSTHESSSVKGVYAGSLGSGAEKRVGMSSVRGRFTSGRGISSGWSSSGSEGQGRGAIGPIFRPENQGTTKDLNRLKRFSTSASQSAAAATAAGFFKRKNNDDS